MIIDLDMQRLSNVVGELVKNAEATDAALRAFDHQKVNDDDKRRLQAIHSSLEAVLARQREMLNIFSGTFESYTANELNSETVRRFDPASAVAAVSAQTGSGATRAPRQEDVKPASSPKPNEPKSNASGNAPHGAGNSNQGSRPASSTEEAPIKSLDLGLAGQTPFAGLFNSIATQEISESATESLASQQILAAAEFCRAQ